MARSLGYDIPRIYTLVFAGGVATAALAGGLMAPVRGIDPGTGSTVLLQAFIVVVVGGLGSFRGTIAAGLLVGITDVLVARYISFQLGGITVIFILLIVLVVRPRGLFGEKGVMES
jgi:branched-chain amino acid transport system permease protein